MGSASLAIFLAVTSFVVLLFTLIARRGGAVEVRLEGLAGGTNATATAALPGRRTGGEGLFASLLPTSEDARKKMGKRLIQAGLYKTNSKVYYFISKIVLMAVPIVLGLVANSMGAITFQEAFYVGGIAGAFGTIIPGIWLDMQRKKRQTEVRRALPDALDVIVVCIEGGLSMPGAISRVSKELATAHRTLAAEMVIVQREIQLGRSTGDAMLRFADRFDLEELRSLAAVILQAERFGASITKALRVHAESLRMKRRQKAEENAQKASVKLIFPTVLCIFPALFVVLAGPAVLNIIDLFAKISARQ